jgi:hypothetical protein
VRPPVTPPPPPRTTPPSAGLHTIAEADALANGFPRGGITNTELATAASQPGWPLLARLRFVSELAHADETFFAEQAMQRLQVPDVSRALTAVKRLRQDLANGRAWETAAWDVAELVPGTAAVTNGEARQLWGIAMAMLLAAAELPTRLRVQAIQELADLGHHDEAALIAQGMLRERRAEPALITEADSFLSQAEDGTPGRTGAGRPASRRSGRASPPT